MTQTKCLCAREGNNRSANKRLVRLPTVPKGISFSKPRMHLLSVREHESMSVCNHGALAAVCSSYVLAMKQVPKVGQWGVGKGTVG